MKKLKFKKFESAAILPHFKTKGASGMDISCIENIEVCPGEFLLVNTGLGVEVPKGYEVQVRPRSSICKTGLIIPNSPGTIDSDYRGPIKVGFLNVSKASVFLMEHERIAQIVMCKIYRPDISLVQELSSTDRGGGGFGSTGRF